MRAADGGAWQDTVVWRARVPLAQPLEHLCWYFGAEKVGVIYPISADTGVWTFSAPIRCAIFSCCRLLFWLRAPVCVQITPAHLHPSLK